MIELFGRRNSANVQRVTWALAELGLECKRLNVGGSFGGTSGDSYRALNPTGRVPTLRDGGVVIWESEAILRYLAATYGAGALWPEAPSARARADQWVAWTAGVLGPAMMAVFYRTVRLPRDEQDPAAIAPHAEALVAAVQFLDAHMGDAPYLGGDAFSYGDIPAGVLTYRYQMLPHVTRPETPRLSAWYARLEARPAFRAHVQLPMGTCLEEWYAHEKALA